MVPYFNCFPNPNKMKSIFSAKVVQKYRNANLNWYGWRGHKGVDLNFRFEPLYSPVTGTVVGVERQVEMGLCIYVKDVRKNTHVFAHMLSSKVSEGQSVNRETLLGITGNSGTITSGPHLHYEAVTRLPQSVSDMVMIRSLPAAKGFNTNPIHYLKNLYSFYKIPLDR